MRCSPTSPLQRFDPDRDVHSGRAGSDSATRQQASGNAGSRGEIEMAQGQEKPAKTNKPKLTTKEKQEQKKETKAATG